MSTADPAEQPGSTTTDASADLEIDHAEMDQPRGEWQAAKEAAAQAENKLALVVNRLEENSERRTADEAALQAAIDQQAELKRAIKTSAEQRETLRRARSKAQREVEEARKRAQSAEAKYDEALLAEVLAAQKIKDLAASHGEGAGSSWRSRWRGNSHRRVHCADDGRSRDGSQRRRLTAPRGRHGCSNSRYWSVKKQVRPRLPDRPVRSQGLGDRRSGHRPPRNQGASAAATKVCRCSWARPAATLDTDRVSSPDRFPNQASRTMPWGPSGTAQPSPSSRRARNAVVGTAVGRIHPRRVRKVADCGIEVHHPVRWALLSEPSPPSVGFRPGCWLTGWAA